MKFFRLKKRNLESYDDFVEVEHRYIEVAGGVKLHAATCGLGTGRPLLVFLHGFPEWWHSWRHQIAAFKDDYEILAVDMRGFGLSDAPKGVDKYTMGRLCADVAAAIHGAGHSSCYLVAHDWGGAVAWCFAANYPHMVKRLAILCSPHPASYKDPKRFDSEQARHSWYFLLFLGRGLPELWLRNRDFEKIEELMLRGAWGVRTKGAISQADIEKQKAALSRPGALTAAINYYRASIRDQTSHPSPELNRALTAVLKMPVLLMHADHDNAFCPKMFKDTDRNVAQLTTVQLPDCSHWANQDRPDLVNSHLETFFAADKGLSNTKPGVVHLAASPRR